MKSMQWLVAPVAVLALAGALGQAAGAASAVERARGGAAAVVVQGSPGPHGAVAPGTSARGAAVAVKAPKWWRIVKLDGEPLGARKVDRGAHAGKLVNRVVVGKRYRLQGQLPVRLRDAFAGRRLVVEAKADSRTAWTTVGRFTAGSDGRFTTSIRVTRSLFGLHKYRIKVLSGERSTRQSTTLPGGAVTAVADTSFTLTFANDTKSELLFTFPTWPDPDSGQYDNGQFAVNQNTSVKLVYTNPVQNVTGIAFFAQRQTCLIVNCSLYYANWDHAPKKKGPAPCNTVSPTFVSGGDYTIRVTPQMGTTGFDMFLLDANGNVICTGALSTKFSQWLGNHPTARWAVILLAADAAINAVAGVIAGGIYAIWGEAIAAGIAEYWLDVEAINFPAIVVMDPDTEMMVACLAWDKYVRQQPAGSDSCMIDD